jgi:hypothetical protein
MKKTVLEFAGSGGLVRDGDNGVYGYYNLLNVSMQEGRAGTVITIHNRFKKIDSLEADLKKFGFIEKAYVDERGNTVINTLDKKYGLKQSDYKWILDCVLDFVKKFDLKIGNCENCGRAGASFFVDAKTGEYYHVCENCLNNVRSGFNQARGEKTGFWAAIGRFFRGGKKSQKNLVALAKPNVK